jgi:hypothetical protein
LANKAEQTYDYHANKPYGLSFIGRKFEDAKIVSYAYSFEQIHRVRDTLKPCKSLPSLSGATECQPTVPAATAKTQLKDVMQ